MIDVILPCLDEAPALPRVLADVPAGLRPLVVDNGSTDGSAEIAAGLGAQIVRCAEPGYGAACHAGLLASTTEVIAFCDCDGSLRLADVADLARPVLDGSADLALGRRVAVSRDAWPPHARLANAVLARRLRQLGLPVHDVSPARVVRRDALLTLGVSDRRSGYPLELLVRAARAGWRVAERNVDYHPRVGRSKVTGSVLGTVRAVRDMSVVLARD
ncbi:glycosyltransferase family 2 protein [Luteipulveratus sp. YIM 133132]|uniref:glycosyltransferase family 2 protein n=1 Tax=Luteipulveratus flavus TaxID=3031728 RepID=UPI0023B04074|nr:glycosyltransferase family 2 protein [Luteipulveratus sp. YIM 133132]MDE9364759.1 glycosyltransferase family 2 protein [Luteipulveratus sp. YIM 133132]